MANSLHVFQEEFMTKEAISVMEYKKNGEQHGNVLLDGTPIGILGVFKKEHRCC